MNIVKKMRKGETRKTIFGGFVCALGILLLWSAMMYDGVVMPPFLDGGLVYIPSWIFVNNHTYMQTDQSFKCRNTLECNQEFCNPLFDPATILGRYVMFLPVTACQTAKDLFKFLFFRITLYFMPFNIITTFIWILTAYIDHEAANWIFMMCYYGSRVFITCSYMSYAAFQHFNGILPQQLSGIMYVTASWFILLMWVELYINRRRFREGVVNYHPLV
jgi:hypothetical protein